MAHPADRIRLRPSMMADDPERFFRRHPFEISDGEIWRWVAACHAESELLKAFRKDDDEE